VRRYSVHGRKEPGRTAVRPYSVLALLVLCLALGPGPAAAQSSGADREVLAGLEGGRLSEADLEEGVTILVVWASWSPRCRDVGARIDALAAAWSSRARVASVVFQEEPEAIRHFLKEQGLKEQGLDDQGLGAERPAAPIYIDTTGTFSKKHSVTTLPSLLVFEGGKAVFRGKLPADPDPVIERALAP
jgi:thiol-disulfide isomerase/thioredoxin